MTTDHRAALVTMLQRDEGLRLKPYRDTVGKLTIGYGRNLEDRGITEAEAEYLLERDVDQAIAALYHALPWTAILDPVRQIVLVNMSFNLGLRGLLQFKRTLQSVHEGKYAEAAKGMLQSKWATQVGQRAVRLADMMRSGV